MLPLPAFFPDTFAALDIFCEVLMQFLSQYILFFSWSGKNLQIQIHLEEQKQECYRKRDLILDVMPY